MTLDTLLKMAIQPPTELKRQKDATRDRAYVVWKKQRYYFGKWGSKESKEDFRKWLLQVLGSPTSSTPKDRITVAECVDHYLTHAKNYYSANGKTTGEYTNVVNAMAHLLTHAGGRKDLAAQFGPKKLIAIQKALANQKKGEKRVYARTTINAMIHRMRRCFRWCASQELIPAEIVNALDMVPGIPKGRTDAREPDPVESVPIPIVVATLPFLSPTVAAMAKIQTLCGMRPQDICGMIGAGLDMTGDIWLYRPVAHKTAHLGKSLVKAIPPHAQRLLAAFLRDDPNEPIFSPADSLEYWRSLERKRQPRPRSKPRTRRPYSTGSYGKAITYAIARAEKANIKIGHWSPNQLRHAIATQLREMAGIESAQLYLGHSKPDTTLIYAEKSVNALSEVARQLVSPFDVKRDQR